MGVVCHLGPVCRLLAYPRILLGASHTWVAHSSWTLHIQIAVMNIIREEHWGAVQGTQTHKYTFACKCTNTSTCTQVGACSASCIWSSTYRADDTKVCMLFSDKNIVWLTVMFFFFLNIETHTQTHTQTSCDARHFIFTPVLSVPFFITSSTGQPAHVGRSWAALPLSDQNIYALKCF